MSGLFLLRPLALLALLPLLGLALWRRYRRPSGRWAALVDPELMPSLRRLGVLVEGGSSAAALLPLIGAGLIALALAGPAQLRPGSTEFRALDPLVLVVDLSPSVVAEQKLLSEAQMAAAELLAMANGRPVGMMVYSADAYLASAPSTDAAGLQGLVAALSRETIPVAGSRPDIALSMARDLFSTRDGPGLGGADLVVISDGGGAGVRATEEAARLKSEDTRVWALVLPGAASGAPPVNADGLAELAAAGGGAALGIDRVAELGDRIARARTARLAREETSARSVHDYGPWLLPLAMAALFPLFRRRR